MPTASVDRRFSASAIATNRAMGTWITVVARNPLYFQGAIDGTFRVNTVTHTARHVADVWTPTDGSSRRKGAISLAAIGRRITFLPWLDDSVSTNTDRFGGAVDSVSYVTRIARAGEPAGRVGAGGVDVAVVGTVGAYVSAVAETVAVGIV